MRMTMYDQVGHVETSADTEEKDAIGQLWEARSKGRCVFVLATKDRMSNTIAAAVKLHEGGHEEEDG